MNVSLAGQRAVVTAGGAGIGRATVLAMAEAGADVVTCDIDRAALATLPDGIERDTCDVADAEAVDAFLDAALADGLDILVNNAGIAGPTAPIEDVTVDEWRRCLAVGIDSQFLFARRVAPVFKRQRSGAIVNMASTAGIMGYPNRAPYAVAKWASVGLTKTLAMELGPLGVRVNAVAPGSVTGERIDRVVRAHAEAEGISEDEVRRSYTLGVSMQTFIDPEEIAALICFLCSDHGRHISGQVIGIDGHTETLHPRL